MVTQCEEKRDAKCDARQNANQDARRDKISCKLMLIN
jgi:hypothetical protein